MVGKLAVSWSAISLVSTFLPFRIFVNSMPRTARQVLTALLITLHAVISLCGPSLHAAPGLGHKSLAEVSSRTDGLGEWGKITATPAEHCPVCEYFAQAQLPFHRVILVSSRLVLPFEPAHSPILNSRPLSLSSQPRAPPLGDARVV